MTKNNENNQKKKYGGTINPVAEKFEKIFEGEGVAKKHQDIFDIYDLYQRTMDIIERAYGGNKKVVYKNTSTKDSAVISAGTYGITR